MIKLYSSILFVVLSLIQTVNASEQSCTEYLNKKSGKLVRIYGDEGVIVPGAVVCNYCGVKNFMPASINDPRFTITNTVADIDGLREKSGDKAPDFLGASLQCDNCSGHTPLWRLGRPGEAPIPEAKYVMVDIKKDPTNERRYIELPEEYQELADPDSEMNRLANAHHAAICPSCGNMTLTDSKPAGGLNCPSCAGHIPQENIYNTKKLLANQNGAKQEPQSDDKPAEPTVDETGSVQASTSQASKPQSTDFDLETKRSGRKALGAWSKKWIAGGAVAVSALLGSTYYYNNTPVIAEGVVVEIKRDNVAIVQFRETPYFDGESNLASYQAQILLNELNSLPGELQTQIEKGDYVTIHYTWSDFHILPFVFHPYSAAEFFDGSFVEGSQIK